MSKANGRPLRILIAVLTTYERHGWPTHYIGEWLEQIRLQGESLPYAVRVLYPHNFCPAAAGRNSICDFFLKQTDADWILMVDNDMAPPPNILDCVKDAPEDADVVVPRFWLWDQTVPSVTMCWGILDAHPTQEMVNALFLSKDFVPLRKCGTGCIFIRRRVFENLAKPWFWYPYNENGGIAATEDIMFCGKVLDAGMKIYGNGRFEVGHYHNVNLSKVAELVYFKRPTMVDNGDTIVTEAGASPVPASATAASPA